MEHKIKIKNNDKSCTVIYDKPDNENKLLTEKKELAIKALMFLQFNCMTSNDDTLNDIINILDSAIDEINDINNPTGVEHELFNYYN